MKTATTVRGTHTRDKKYRKNDLLEAAYCGTVSAVRKLVQAGIKVNVEDKDGFTPLMFAIMRQNSKMAAYLIGKEADVNHHNKLGLTALMLAAQVGNIKLVKQLIIAGADLQAVDKNKRNAVYWAASRGDFPEVISMLGVFKADPNTQNDMGMTPLIAAALMGHENSVAVLLVLGADDKFKFRGKTAHQIAAKKGYTEVCKTMKAVLKGLNGMHL